VKYTGVDALAREGQARFHFVGFVWRGMGRDKLRSMMDRERRGEVCLVRTRWGGQTSA
jgi:hypothetical protein